MNKILVVNVNWLGDVIFSSPVFKALKTAYPGCHVACLAPPRVKDILEMISGVDEIIIYDEKGRHSNPFAKLGLILQLRKKNFDAAFLLHRSLTRALFVFLAGIPKRIGYDTKKRSFLLTHKVSPLKEPVHRSDYYLNVIESFGVKVNERMAQIIVPQDERGFADDLLKKNRINASDFLVVVNTGGNWDLKRWPKKNFRPLVNALAKEQNVKVVICGAEKDKSTAEEIAESAEVKPVILAGQTNLKQLAALLARANVVISADSGPLHIANCVGANVIGLFGPTRPEITGPRGQGRFTILKHDVGCNRLACYYLECPDNSCMKAITVNDVIEEFKRSRN